MDIISETFLSISNFNKKKTKKKQAKKSIFLFFFHNKVIKRSRLPSIYRKLALNYLLPNQTRWELTHGVNHILREGHF